MGGGRADFCVLAGFDRRILSKKCHVFVKKCHVLFVVTGWWEGHDFWKKESRHAPRRGRIPDVRMVMVIPFQLANSESNGSPAKSRITPHGVVARKISAPLIRTMLTGLLFECPLGEAASDCLLCRIRTLPARERVRWLQELGDTTCRGIYFNHLQCLEKKVGPICLGSR